ncbi:hypothetical protein FISHEDRAFT_31844, partial [Fistulina hepatica ATCC 64428]
FLRFLIYGCYNGGGRVVVAEMDGKLVSFVAWLPPNKRLTGWRVIRSSHHGLFTTLRHWGRKGLGSVVSELGSQAEQSYRKAFTARGRPASDYLKAWHLCLAGTEPAYQGRGLISRLIRENIQRAPGLDFTVEAGTPHAANVYRHVGFETCEIIYLGQGKVGTDGLPASGERAKGV